MNEMPRTVLEFTHEGLLANLDTIEELVSGAMQCLTTEGLEEFGKSLLKTAIFVLSQTRKRAKSMEAV